MRNLSSPSVLTCYYRGKEPLLFYSSYGWKKCCWKAKKKTTCRLKSLAQTMRGAPFVKENKPTKIVIFLCWVEVYCIEQWVVLVVPPSFRDYMARVQGRMVPSSDLCHVKKELVAFYHFEFKIRWNQVVIQKPNEAEWIFGVKWQLEPSIRVPLYLLHEWYFFLPPPPLFLKIGAGFRKYGRQWIHHHSSRDGLERNLFGVILTTFPQRQ